MGCVEAFAGRVVGAGPDRAHRSGDPELIAEIGEGPGSVLGSVVGVEHGAVQAPRVEAGIRSASATRLVRMWSAMDQPTTLRLKQSSTVAR